ncbi:hypothetical protein BV898_15748 [Hypsibius exemplaris]|uniref:Uncharacterized protein n=1 Tax=Hypsibius exemplaris TaxID=2072580 RepID=A0A9X6NEI3_HYPEX|nr:hypothetical protein BV898_15748 [Hypsibius exemplaris]
MLEAAASNPRGTRAIAIAYQEGKDQSTAQQASGRDTAQMAAPAAISTGTTSKTYGGLPNQQQSGQGAGDPPHGGNGQPPWSGWPFPLSSLCLVFQIRRCRSATMGTNAGRDWRTTAGRAGTDRAYPTGCVVRPAIRDSTATGPTDAGRSA